ncbi:MAG: FeoB-associated Cys-rich membrane protein [Magnetococcales bacterium]|nr:FeoB-associated Cys-rich membrane protein [Magnetococcales bacterium]
MNAAEWLDTIIVGVIMLLCVVYIYKSATKLFAEKKPGEGCGSCSSGGSCSRELKAAQTKE